MIDNYQPDAIDAPNTPDEQPPTQLEASETPPQPDYAYNLEDLKRWYSADCDGAVKAREEAELNRRYYDGEQITDADKHALTNKRRLPIEENWVRLAINGLTGVLERGKVDPKALPRNPQDQDSSKVATKVLRYVQDMTRLPRKKQDAAKNFFIEGTAAIIIEVDGRSEVTLRRIRFEEFVADRYSKELDFNDAARMSIGKWMELGQVAALYPQHREDLNSFGTAWTAAQDNTWRDRPEDATVIWSDPKRRRLLVVEMYHQEGGIWHRCIFTGGVLLLSGLSPYLDDNGQPTNPIIACSAYIDGNNYRYGSVRDMRGPQDSINKRNIELLALASNRQIQEREAGSALTNAEEARKEAARPDGVLPPGWIVVQTGDMSMLQAQLLEQAKAFMQRVSPNPAVLGREGENSSGRNNLVRQQAGLTESADLYSILEDWEKRIYEQIWLRVRQWWTAPKVMRVTDDEKDFAFINLNKPETEMQRQQVPTIVVDPATGQRYWEMREVVQEVAVIDPQTGQPKMENDVSKIGVDIIVDSVPDTASLQQEEFAVLVELAKIGALGPRGPAILLRASSLTNKRELIEALENPPPQQQQAPPDPRQQLAVEGMGAKVEADKARAAGEAAKVQKTQTETQGVQLDNIQKQLDLMRSAHESSRPEDGYLRRAGM